MSSVIIFYWTKAIILSSWIGLIVAIPVDYPSSSDLLAVPSLTYEDGLTPVDGFLARGGPSSHRPRRAPWAPSLTRPESYFRKAMDIMDRAGTKRSVQGMDALPLRSVVDALRRWNQRRDDGETVEFVAGVPVDAKVVADGFGEPVDEANLARNYEDILVARDGVVSPEAFAIMNHRWRQDPRRDYEGVVKVRIEEEEERGGGAEGKRGGGSPLYIGFGQHAANAAIDAFEGILDEGKNEKQERVQNPVRFLGRRR